MDSPFALAAQAAAKALIALGWPVVSVGEGSGLWEIGFSVFTDIELLEFAAWAEIDLLGS